MPFKKNAKRLGNLPNVRPSISLRPPPSQFPSIFAWDQHVADIPVHANEDEADRQSSYFGGSVEVELGENNFFLDETDDDRSVEINGDFNESLYNEGVDVQWEFDRDNALLNADDILRVLKVKNQRHASRLKALLRNRQTRLASQNTANRFRIIQYIAKRNIALTHYKTLPLLVKRCGGEAGSNKYAIGCHIESYA